MLQVSASGDRFQPYAGLGAAPAAIQTLAVLVVEYIKERLEVEQASRDIARLFFAGIPLFCEVEKRHPVGGESGFLPEETPFFPRTEQGLRVKAEVGNDARITLLADISFGGM